ncbi:MAG: hypothetical protein RR313_12630, partial [Anaerovoracaceae bacterium]
SIEELNAYIADYMEIYNNRPRDNFEGYSSMEMHRILDYTFEDSSPIKLHKLSDEEYAKIPILRQIKHLIQIIQKEGRIKLTTIGNLPTRVVKELYPLGVGDRLIDSGISKLSKETDSNAVELTKILLKLMRVTKIRNNVLTITKEGEKILANNERLMKNIMITFCCKFNKAYFDGYESEQIGNMGVGFTLLLLNKYGTEKRSDNFYADKYFKAFPLLLDGLLPTYNTVEHIASSCYSIRTFDRLLLHLGLIEIDEERHSQKEKKDIIKTEFFDKLISVVPPHNM